MTSPLRLAQSGSPQGRGLLHQEIGLKAGLWEKQVDRDGTSVEGPFQDCVFAGSSLAYFFPSIFPAEGFGNDYPQRLTPDRIAKLPDGRYRVTGGLGTRHGGMVTWEHIVSLAGDDRYEGRLTVTSHVKGHRAVTVYHGSGHWLGPCPIRPEDVTALPAR